MAREIDKIDVRQLIDRLSVEELNLHAEDYFARIQNWDYHLAKPCADAAEAPQLLINFAVVLQGLDLCRGLRVLEFGAGSCWASRFLAQMGCSVVATDVSKTALEKGKELFRRQPPIGDVPEAEFLLFDGKHIDLPDESVDRIICLDAFHHVPNQEVALNEMARVLRKGGIAGFAEPGPNHSRTEMSQYEMRNFTVIENDIEIEEVWRLARVAGFTEIELSVFNIPSFRLTLPEYTELLNGSAPLRKFAEATRNFLQNQRTFFLYKHRNTHRDSRFAEGLRGEIHVGRVEHPMKSDEPVRFQVMVRNTSKSVWLPRSAGTGAVHLGMHLSDGNGSTLRESFHWEALTPGDGRPVLPGESVTVDVATPPLMAGHYILQLDLVSQDVCWFSKYERDLPRVSVQIL